MFSALQSTLLDKNVTNFYLGFVMQLLIIKGIISDKLILENPFLIKRK